MFLYYFISFVLSGKRNDIERRYSIGEVANLVGVREHTIRFWTSQFPHIRFIVGLGKRRYYKRIAIKQMQEIRYLMKELRFSISKIKEFLPKSSLDKRRASLLLLSFKPEIFNLKKDSLFVPVDVESLENIVYSESVKIKNSSISSNNKNNLTQDNKRDSDQDNLIEDLFSYSSKNDTDSSVENSKSISLGTNLSNQDFATITDSLDRIILLTQNA